MNFGLILAGLLYAVVFWAVGMRRPWLTLALIAAAAPFQNDISGGGPLKFSLAEINVLLALPIVLARGTVKFGPTLLPSLGYIGVGVLCSIPNWHDSSLICLVQMGIYLVIVVMVFASLARNEEDYRAALTAYVAVGVFLALSVAAFHSPYIYGMHKNGVGGSVATAFVIAFEMWLSVTQKRSKRRFLFAVAILGFGSVMILSRGAWMTAIVGVLVIFALRREFGMLIRTALLLVPVVCVGWLLLPAEDREYATGFQADRDNIRARYESIDFAMAQFRANPILGGGVGLRKEFDATNLFMVTLAETGVPGVLSFAILQLAVAVLVWRTHRRVSKGTLGFSVVAIAGALTFGKLAHGMVDHYWGRGSLTMAWASVGMAVRVATESQKRRRQAIMARAAELSLSPVATAPVEEWGVPDESPAVAGESQIRCA
ncbi:MAG TPA: O-antigen ligase family protein [Chthoniobacter sp.]|nr:O-antigen ligase family protein [Chthoniobacter sp.]